MTRKYCPRCDGFIDVRRFAKNAVRRDGLNSYCRDHQKEYQQNWYQRNKAAHTKQVQARNRRVRDELRQIVMEHLIKHPCVDCGESDPVVLEFDHVHGEKKDSIGGMRMRRNCSVETLQTEIAKCEVRCANCHRRRTAKVFGWSKALGL